MNDEDRTPFDDFLEEILKREGDTGDDFKLGSIDAEIMRWALHLIAMAFVACHVETRQRYMPAVPTRTLNQDLVQWTVEHMRRFVDRLRTGNFPITNEQVQAIETILMRQSQDILAILDLPPRELAIPSLIIPSL